MTVPDQDYIRRKIATATAKVGRPIDYRRVERLVGPNPVKSPPSTGSLLVAGAVSSGSTIAFDAASVTGYLRSGDKFRITGDNTLYTITNQVVAVANAFTGVTFAPPLAAPAADNAPVTMYFAGDVAGVIVRVSGYPANLIDGAIIQARDLLVILPAVSLPFDPRTADLVRIDGVWREIVSARPRYIRDLAGMWDLQTR